jgi:hypothetical protein
MVDFNKILVSAREYFFHPLECSGFPWVVNRQIRIATSTGLDSSASKACQPTSDCRSLILRCFSSHAARPMRYQLPGKITSLQALIWVRPLTGSETQLSRHEIHGVVTVFIRCPSWTFKRQKIAQNVEWQAISCYKH